MNKVLIVGPSQIDLAAFVEQLPKGNEDDINPSRTITRVGGAGFCAADVFTALNLPYTLLGATGSGMYGDAVGQMAEARNISLSGESEEIGGCTYTMIDKDGNHGLFVVPGAEYFYTNDWAQDLDLDEYKYLYLSGSMFDGEGVLDLLDLVREFSGQIIFQLGGRSVIQNGDILSEIYQKHPIVYVTAEELYILTEESDLMHASEKLQDATGAPVLVLLNDGGAFYLEGHTGISASTRINRVVDSSGIEECFGGAFVCARAAGLNPRAALNFACEYIANVAMSEEMTLPLEQRKTMQDLLVKTILGK